MAAPSDYKGLLCVSTDQPIAGRNYPDNRSFWHPFSEITRGGNTGTIWWTDNGPKGTDSLTIEPRTFCYKGLATINFTGTSLAVRINVAYNWFNNAVVLIDGVAPSTLGLSTARDTLSSDARDYTTDVELKRYIDVLVADGLTDGSHVCTIDVNNSVDVGSIDKSRFFSLAGYRVGVSASQVLVKTGSWICPIGDDVSQNKFNLTFSNQSTKYFHNVDVEFPGTLVDEFGGVLADLIIPEMKPGASVRVMVQPVFTGDEMSSSAAGPVTHNLTISAECADPVGVLGPKVVAKLTAFDYEGTLALGPFVVDGYVNWFYGADYIQSTTTVTGSELLFPAVVGDSLTVTYRSDTFYTTVGLYLIAPGAAWVNLARYDADGVYLWPDVPTYNAANRSAYDTWLAANGTLVGTIPASAGAGDKLYTVTGLGAGSHTIYLQALELGKATVFVEASWASNYTTVVETVGISISANQPIAMPVEGVAVGDYDLSFDAPVAGVTDFGPPKQSCTLVSPPYMTGGTVTNTYGHRKCTITTGAPHGFGRNEVVTIRGADQDIYNAKLVITPVDTTSFTYVVDWPLSGTGLFSGMGGPIEPPDPTTTHGYTVQSDFVGVPVRKNTDLVYTEVLARFPTFAVCYQSGFYDILAQYDVLIIDPIAAASRDVIRWREKGIEVYGYVASGEEVGFYSERYNFSSPLAPNAGSGPGGWAAYYMFTRYGTTGAGWAGTWTLPDKNGVWASYYTNPDPAYGWPARVDGYYAPLVLDGPSTYAAEVLTFHDVGGVGRVTDTAHSPIDPDELLEIYNGATVFHPYSDFTFDAKTGAIVMNQSTDTGSSLFAFNNAALGTVNGGATTIAYTRKGHHCDGIFWDVVDTPDVYLSHTFEFGYAYVAGYDTLFKAFLNNFKTNHPDAKMISNRGFTILPDIIQSCSGVMFESWLTHPTDIDHLFTTDYARIDTDLGYNEGVNQELIDLRTRGHMFDVFSLNYCLPGDPGQPLRDYCQTEDGKRGYYSWTSTITLDVPAPQDSGGTSPSEGVGPPVVPVNQFDRYKMKRIAA
jgi:hypothetical protein